jgi:hypothetical protein
MKLDNEAFKSRQCAMNLGLWMGWRCGDRPRRLCGGGVVPPRLSSQLAEQALGVARWTVDHGGHEASELKCSCGVVLRSLSQKKSCRQLIQLEVSLSAVVLPPYCAGPHRK